MKKLIAVLLVLSLVLAFAGCAKTEPAPDTTPSTPVNNTPNTSEDTTPSTSEDTTPSEPETVVMSYAEFMAAETDSEVTVETYVQAGESWWDGAVALYCQGPDGAYYLYGMACSEEDAAKLVPGTKIRATGTKAVWNGEVEIMEGSIEILEGESYIAEAADLTALLGTDELTAHMNELGAFNGLTVVASKNAAGEELPFLYNWDGSGEADKSDLYFNVALGDKVFTFTVNRYMIGTGTDSALYSAVKSLEIGDTVNVTGFLYWYNALQLHTTSLTIVE